MTLDGLLSILLSTVVPVVMTVLGVVMTIRQSAPAPMPPKEKWRWIITFVFMGMLAVCAAVWQQTRLTVQQAAAETRANTAEKRRVSDTQYTNGKLDAVAAFLGTLAKNPNTSNTEIAAALAKAVKQPSPDPNAARRAESQRDLASLLAEGMRISDCFKQKGDATDAKITELRDWETRARNMLAARVNPSRLSEFDEGYTATAGSKAYSQVCWQTYGRAKNLEGIMAEEFAPPLTDSDKQRIAQSREKIGKALGEGQRLFEAGCSAIPEDGTPDAKRLSAAIIDWEGSTLVVVTGTAGTPGMEYWDEAETRYIGTSKTIKGKCNRLDARLLALRNIIRVGIK